MAHDTGVFNGVGELVDAWAVGQCGAGGQTDSKTKGDEPGSRFLSTSVMRFTFTSGLCAISPSFCGGLSRCFAAAARAAASAACA